MIRMMGILVCSAWMIRDWTLPSVVSLPALVTRMSSTPGKIARAGEDLHAGHLIDGQRLAGDRRLVDGAQAVVHLAVGGDVVARTHADAIPGPQLADLDLPLAAVLLEQVGPYGGQADQRFDGGPGAQRRSRLHKLAEQHEKADEPGGDILLRGERGHNAQRRQLIHVRFASREALDRMDDDRRPEKHGPEQGEDLDVEASGLVEEPPDAAVDQQHAAGQRGQHRDADAKLLAAGLLGAEILLKVQVLVSHSSVLLRYSHQARDATRIAHYFVV